jgi:hypothetical protein
MKLASCVLLPSVASVLFWLVFASCVIAPPEDPPLLARIVISWDTRACGAPHRVVVELEDEDGIGITSSVPCGIGALSLDAPRWGIYRGRFYSTWAVDEPVRSVTPVTIAVDAPIVRWPLAAPP